MKTATSYNTGYTARFSRPNPFGTSYSPNTLSEIGRWLRERKYLKIGDNLLGV